MNKEKIFAVIVTYNRKKLLEECVKSLLFQSRRPDKIIIVNNNSNDGTSELIENLSKKNKIIKHIKLKENTGSSGGQYAGFKAAYKGGADWIWTMDDDTIPKETALQELVHAKEFLKNKSKIGYLASRIINVEGEDINVPRISLEKGKALEWEWGKYLQEQLIKISDATFVSIMFSREFILNLGFPIKEFFIWGDDIEYTQRGEKEFESFLVGKSIAIHKRGLATLMDILEEKNPNRIKNYFYYFRNNLYLERKNNKKKYFFHLLNWGLRKPFLALFMKNGFKKFTIILKGFFASFFFNPRIIYPKNNKK